MNLELRKFRQTEYDRLATIRNSIFSDPMSSQEIKSSDDSFDTKYYRQRYSCFNLNTGEILAFGSIGHMAWSFHPQRFVGSILVDKAYQNRGIGQYIYEKMLELLAKLNANELLASAREDMPVSTRFLENRGFEEKQRISESVLDPTKVDVSSFSGYMEKAADTGVEVGSLSHELENDP
ncbi:MAG TPA: GNAT family N-acetyltransferase, partial [Candidatus Bathyarchaeia archaeon]|nr:GNAT family N-acetyltransferase [Candidatus Bathyarchaeia archaeon]